MLNMSATQLFRTPITVMDFAVPEEKKRTTQHSCIHARSYSRGLQAAGPHSGEPRLKEGWLGDGVIGARGAYSR